MRAVLRLSVYERVLAIHALLRGGADNSIGVEGVVALGPRLVQLAKLRTLALDGTRAMSSCGMLDECSLFVRSADVAQATALVPTVSRYRGRAWKNWCTSTRWSLEVCETCCAL